MNKVTKQQESQEERIKRLIAENRKKTQEQIAAGTHTNCPVCGQFVRITDGKNRMAHRRSGVHGIQN